MPRILSDPLSQYTALRMHYTEKSTEDAGDSKAAAKPVARIMADCSRVYWPGQEVTAAVSISEAACSRDGALEELSVEFKGEIHSYTYSYSNTGQTRTRHTDIWTVPIFSHSATLYSQDDRYQAHGIQVEQLAPKDDSQRTWQIRTRLPVSFTGDNGKGYPLPPTFKDSTASERAGTTFVVYCIKCVAKRSGIFKRDTRTWTPILVTSLPGQSLHPSALIMPPPATPGTLPPMPRGWQRITTKQTIHKALFRDRGELEAQLYSPPFASVSPGVPIPIVLLLIVRTKAIGDATTPNDVVPGLPHDGGKDEPTFKFKRWVRSSSTQLLTGRTHHDEQDKIPVHVEWSRAHLPGGAGGPGHGWTPGAHDSNVTTQAAFPYYTTALLSGLMYIPLSPSFEVSTLAVNYSLHLSIPLHGLRNKLDEEISAVGSSSGVTVAELAQLSVEEASRRAVGGKAPKLQALNQVQGEATEVMKLGQMAARESFGDAAALPWVNEKGRPTH